MPGLVVFRRRWSVGSDDLILPGAFLLTIHFICFVILIITLALFDYDSNIFNVKLLLYQLISFMVTLIMSICIEVAICMISMKGSILDVEERYSIRVWLYLKSVVIVFEIICLVLGSAWLSKYYLDAPDSESKKIFFALIVSDWMLLFVTLMTVWCTFDPAGRSWVKMKKYQRSMREVESRFNYRRSGNANRNWRQRKVIRAYQDSWDQRCRLLFCCIGASKQNRNSFTDIARLLSDFFRDLDVVPSDVVAGLVLLRKFQRLEREAVIRQRKNGTYEFLSGVPITDRTEFLALNDSKNYDFFQTVIHYMYFAQGAYGWPMYFIINRSRMWHLLPEMNCLACCCQSRDGAIVIEDNCCQCNYAALKKTLQAGDIEIVYATYHVDVGETPFFIAIDYTQKTIVISIRGTLSMKDILTDLNAEGEVLPLDPPRDDWLGHKGMTQAAIYIKRKLETENLIERALMYNASRNTETFGLVFVGHSLGAGTAAILAILMKSDYPKLQCFCYSPPGGLISKPAAEYTKSFITSVVLGKDVVPRIGLNQMEALRADLINAIQRSLDPKWKTISCSVICCGCGPEPASVVEMSEKDTHINEYQEQRDTARSTSLHPGDSSIALTCHQPLYPPGRIIHIVRHHPKSNEEKHNSGWRNVLKSSEPVYQAIWADSMDFSEVLISPVMLQDHMPDKVLAALKKVVTTSGPRKPQRQSNAFCTISNDYSNKQLLENEIILSLRNFAPPNKMHLNAPYTSADLERPPYEVYRNASAEIKLYDKVDDVAQQNRTGIATLERDGGTYRETSFTNSNTCCNGIQPIYSNGFYGSDKSLDGADLNASNKHIPISPNIVITNGVPSTNNNNNNTNNNNNKQSVTTNKMRKSNIIPLPLDNNLRSQNTDINGSCFGTAPLASPENFSDISSVSSQSINDALSLSVSTGIGDCLIDEGTTPSADQLEDDLMMAGKDADNVNSEVFESQLHTPKVLRRAPKFSENLANCAEDDKNQDHYKRMGRVFVTFPQFLSDHAVEDTKSSNSFSSNESGHFYTISNSIVKPTTRVTFENDRPSTLNASTINTGRSEVVGNDMLMHYNVPNNNNIHNNDHPSECKPLELITTATTTTSTTTTTNNGTTIKNEFVIKLQANYQQQQQSLQLQPQPQQVQQPGKKRKVYPLNAENIRFNNRSNERVIEPPNSKCVRFPNNN